MRRGTTPVIRLTLKDHNVTDFVIVHVTFKQSDKIITKTESDVTFNTTLNRIEVNLTQEDTLFFAPGSVQMQMRVVTQSNDKLASNITTLLWKEILEEGVI